ncbi:MAG: Asp-tRNA(Asn)/Glu-tRNA(Gln) amidotransferase subunit GatC [Acidobacteria bacterium]|nr:Asp-tRNA(Asn)/Glu-tRNA(Gln) amidotransferase subunit GatC [Acidobacteriota bacterium]
MRITEKDVLYVAALANLELSEQETARLTADMDAILAYVEKLNELDTTATEPMAQVLYEAPEIASLRVDQDRPGLGQEKSLANAPESGAGHFKVAKVIER